MKWTFIIFLLCAALSSPAFALRGPVQKSLGAAIADADCVVAGVVQTAEKVQPPGAENEPSWWKITLTVQETFKGTPGPTLIIYEPVGLSDPWIQDGSPRLYLLRSGAPAGTSFPTPLIPSSMTTWGLRYPLASGLRTVDLNPVTRRDQPPIVTDDLRFLSTPDEILAEARNLQVANPTECVCGAMPEAVGTTLSRNGGWELELALTDDTSTAALRWIASDDPLMRLWGAGVLAHGIGSPAHIQALQQFLRTPSDYDPYYMAGVRARTLFALQRWNVKNLPALVQPSTPLFDVSSPRAWLSVAGAFLLPAVYFAGRRRGHRRTMFLWLAAICALLTLDVRSFWPQDALTCGNLDIAVERGNLYLVDHSRATLLSPAPLIICTPQDLLHISAAVEAVKTYPQYIQYPEGYYGPHSFKELRPPGLSGPVWELPLWLPVTLLTAPLALLWLFRQWRKRKSSRARGFPIQNAGS